MGQQTGTEVSSADLPSAEHVASSTGAGRDEGTAGFVAAIDSGLATGELDTGGTGISGITGQPTRTSVEHVASVRTR